jgi:hypothetical protein
MTNQLKNEKKLEGSKGTKAKPTTGKSFEAVQLNLHPLQLFPKVKI